jgi:hypothetical protein
VLQYVDASDAVEGVAAVVADFGDGRREMHFFMDQPLWALYSSVRAARKRENERERC